MFWWCLQTWMSQPGGWLRVKKKRKRNENRVFLAKLTKLRIIISKRTRIIHRETKRKKGVWAEKLSAQRQGKTLPTSDTNLLAATMWKRGRWRERARILWTCFFFSSTFPPSGDVHHSDGRTRRKTRVKMCVCVYWEKRASPRIMERKNEKGNESTLENGEEKEKKLKHTHAEKKVIFYT